MRFLAAAILVLVMVSGFAQNPASESDEIDLYSPLDSINYYFGISLGHSIRGASFKIDPALVAVGLYQALEGTTPVSLEESQEIVMEINQRLINQKLD